MRTDLIAAWLVKQWLMENAPRVGANWDFDVSEEIKSFAARVKGMYQYMDAIFASQSAIAATAIHHWNLDKTVIFGGGATTPLSPKPDQILYFTDANPIVVEEASKQDYDAMIVDVNNVEHLSQLQGAMVGIATGLFHFLDDEQVQYLLRRLATAGIHTMVFNNVDPLAGEELMDQWNKLGNQMFARTTDEMMRIMPNQWEIVEALPLTDFIIHNQQLGTTLADQPIIYNIYLARNRLE